MRIVVNGQQAFGRAVLEAALDRGDEVVGVFCNPDREGRPVDPLKAAAVDRGVPVFQPSSYRDAATVRDLRSLAPDVCLMAYVTQFVPTEALEVPTHGTIQYHPSLLPRHRGPSSINWPIIAGETSTGLTVFWPDEDLDHGPILLQKTVTIGPDATVGSVYFDHLFPMGVAAMLEALDLVRAGTPPKVAQDESNASYEGWCRDADARIDWGQPVEVVANLIRGTDPQPGAWTTVDGRIVKLYGATRQPTVDGSARGTITAVDPDGVTIAALGGQIRAGRVRIDGGPKIAAAESGLTVGDRAET